jgi:hypothetical protein
MNKMALRILPFASLMLLLPPASSASEAIDTYRALRAVRPAGTAVVVQNLVIERDVLRFRFESGSFQFLAPVEGRRVGAIFSGSGTFELRPASEIERHHLQFLTGDKSLEILTEPFESLVLLFTDGTEAEIQAHGSPAPSSPPVGVLYDTFFEKQRKSLRANLQIRLLEELLRAPDPSHGIFLAYVPGKKLPAGLAAYDPRGLDWLFGNLGGETTAFSPIEESENHLWYCSASKADATAGRSPSARAATRALSYAIDTTIERNTEIQGTTTIRLVPLEANVRVVALSLLPKLRLKAAEFANGDSEAWTPAAFVQEDEKEDAEAAVLFPAELGHMGATRLRLIYHGKNVLRDAGDGNFLVGARESWYPNLGTFTDVATYELTYRFPKDFTLVSVGRAAEERVDGDKKVAVWKADRPIRVAGFNYGKFRKLEREDKESGVTVDVYANIGTPDFIHELNGLLARRASARPIDPHLVGIEGGIHAGDIGIATSDDLATAGLSGVHVDVEGLAESATVDAINTARVAGVHFGPLPVNLISITQQTQAFFGQSWPSLIYLPYIAALDGTTRRELGLRDAEDFIQSVGPHEFAHQWWGHLVGWASYRDQWLSEGFAEFTAALVLEKRGGTARAADFWEKARLWILAKPRNASVTNSEAGPIWEGRRLSTHQNPWAWDAMGYSKGAYVLHMLRMMMRDPRSSNPDAKFIDMMKDYASSFAGKNPSTRDFQAVVERHMQPAMDLTGDRKADWFFREWVYGTDIPRFNVKLDIAPAGAGQYRISGSLAEEGVGPEFRSLVPLYLEFGKGELVRVGVATLQGTQPAPLDFTLKLPKAPKRVVVNALHDVLARN